VALYLYIPGQSAVHRLHPTAKLAGMLCFFVAAFITERAALLLPLTAGVALLLALSGSLANVRRLRVLFLLVFLMTFVIWTLFYRQGEAWFSLGPLSVGPQSLRYALGMALKLTTFLAVGTLFLSTAKVEEFSYALTRLGLPYKIGFTMTLAFRLVPAFVESGFTVVQAQRCRGFDFDEGSIFQRIRRYVPVIVPVFIGALRRADNMAMALEARGFQSGRPRTFFQRYTFRPQDGLALVLLVGVAAGYLWMWHLGLTRLSGAN
jgi:energy-coupling factor transport system permease protein